jgi:hypothetical protein
MIHWDFLAITTVKKSSKIIHCETPMCLHQFYEAQPCEVLEQPQKPAKDVNNIAV